MIFASLAEGDDMSARARSQQRLVSSKSYHVQGRKVDERTYSGAVSCYGGRRPTVLALCFRQWASLFRRCPATFPCRPGFLGFGLSFNHSQTLTVRFQHGDDHPSNRVPFSRRITVSISSARAMAACRSSPVSSAVPSARLPAPPLAPTTPRFPYSAATWPASASIQQRGDQPMRRPGEIGGDPQGLLVVGLRTAPLAL
jgi:hypothetical protein